MFTVEKILNINCLKNSKIVAGYRNINNEVESVNVMDAPDIVKWISKNEFLLTTGYSISDDYDYVNELFRGLKEKGCAALGIKIKRYFNEMPKYIIELADRYGIPLIELPYDVTFSNIINDITKYSISLQKEDNYTKVKKLIDEGFKHQNIESIVKTLS